MSNRQADGMPFSPKPTPRRKRQAEVVSFEDLLAAHQTERKPGELPREGVVLIGVDTELQARMRSEFPAPSAPHLREPKFGTPESDVPNSGEPKIGEPDPTTADFGEPNLSSQAARITDLGGTDGDNSSSASQLGAPEFTLPDFGMSKSGEPNYGVPKFDTPEQESAEAPRTGNLPADSSEISAEESLADSAAAEFGVPESGEQNFDTVGDLDFEALIQRRSAKKTFTIHPATRIENILSAGEQALLRWYWEQGRPVPGHRSARIVTGTNGEGTRRMAAQAGLVWNTFRNYTRALSTKFAIDIVRPAGNTPRLYVIWHYSAILERIRKAGFTGVIHKSGGGRELVDDESRPAQGRADLRFQELKLMFGTAKPGTPKSGMPNSGVPTYATREQSFGTLSGNLGVPNFGAAIRNKNYPSEKEHPSATTRSGMPNFKPVIDALFERTGKTDIEAARMIAKSCTEVNSDIRLEEIARMVRGFDFPKSISNPTGLLIRTLASRCAPETLELYRRRWAEEEEQTARLRASERQENERVARMIFDDPESDEESREWARSILGS